MWSVGQSEFIHGPELAHWGDETSLVQTLNQLVTLLLHQNRTTAAAESCQTSDWLVSWLERPRENSPNIWAAILTFSTILLQQHRCLGDCNFKINIACMFIILGLQGDLGLRSHFDLRTNWCTRGKMEDTESILLNINYRKKKSFDWEAECAFKWPVFVFAMWKWNPFALLCRVASLCSAVIY